MSPSRLLLFTLLLSASYLDISAQNHSIGIQIGLINTVENFNGGYFKSFVLPNQLYHVKSESDWGNSFGITYGYTFRSHLCLKMGFDFMQKKYSHIISYFDYTFENQFLEIDSFIFPSIGTSNLSYRNTLQQWSIPFTLGYAIPIKRLQIIPQIGLRLSSLKESTSSGYSIRVDYLEEDNNIDSQEDEYVVTISKYDNRPQYSPKNMLESIISLELKYPISKRMDVNLSIIQQRTIIKSLNYLELKSISFSGGISFKINKKIDEQETQIN